MVKFRDIPLWEWFFRADTNGMPYPYASYKTSESTYQGTYILWDSKIDPDRDVIPARWDDSKRDYVPMD